MESVHNGTKVLQQFSSVFLPNNIKFEFSIRNSLIRSINRKLSAIITQ